VSQHSVTRDVASACNSGSSDGTVKVLTATMVGFGISRDRTLHILVDSHGNLIVAPCIFVESLQFINQQMHI